MRNLYRNGLPGGGQLEIRLTQTMYTSDPDQLEVAQRMKPFDLESWITEWTRVAERTNKWRRSVRLMDIRSLQANTISGPDHCIRCMLASARNGFAACFPTYKKAREKF